MKGFNSNTLPIPVIYYHSVGLINTAWTHSYLTMPYSQFEKQIKYLVKNFKTISLEEYWRIRNNLSKPEKNLIVLTFDDGYLDNWIWVYPLLKKYGLKATIFICPEFVDTTGGVRPNLEDVWEGRVTWEDICQWGFLSWEEMRIMESSGLVSIESHTLTHTKYFISDELTGLHHPGGNCLYPIGNIYPGQKPYYIGNTEFEKKIPYGTPFFREESSIIAHRVFINPDFNKAVINILKDVDWYKKDSQINALKMVYKEYFRWKMEGKIITGRESEQEYLQRIKYEIEESKNVIESKLKKKVKFLCWPHGDNNELAHKLAIESGYLMTTTGKSTNFSKNECTRISERIGIDFRTQQKKIKSLIKLKAFSGEIPYNWLLRTKRYFE